MDFSPVYPCGSLLSLSPSNAYIATAEGNRVTVIDSSSLTPIREFLCHDVITSIQWSNDSELLLLPQYKRKLLQSFSITSDWKCKIDESIAGVVWCSFSPDGRSLLSATEHQLRLNIWSLLKKQCIYIKHPKISSSTEGIQFSHSGKYLAVAERREFKDYIGIYSADDGNYELIRSFPVETEDLVSFSFSPDDSYIAIQDTNLIHQFCVYSIDGRLIHRYSSYSHNLGVKHMSWSKDSRFLAVASYDETVKIFYEGNWKELITYYTGETKGFREGIIVYNEKTVEKEKEKSGVGVGVPLKEKEKENDPYPSLNNIESLSSSSFSSLFDAAASSDSSFRSQLNKISSASSLLPSKQSTTKKGTVTSKTSFKSSSAPKPPAKPSSLTSSMTFSSTEAIISAPSPTKYFVENVLNYEIPRLPADSSLSSSTSSSNTTTSSSSSLPRLGVSNLAFSFDSSYLFTISSSSPTAVYIYETRTLSLFCILNHLDKVKESVWHPERNELLMCTGGNKVYLWRREGVGCVEIPCNEGERSMQCKKVEWMKDGKGFLCADKSKFCCVYTS